MNFNIHERFSIRKFSTGTHSARLGKVAIAATTAAAIGVGAGAVSADEVVADAPAEVTAVTETAVAETPVAAEVVAVEAVPTVYETATNLEGLQAAPLAEAVAVQEDAGLITGIINEPVTDASVDAIIDTAAQNPEIDVIEEPLVSHDELKDAKEDLATQKDKVSTVIDTQKEIDGIEANNASQAKAGNVEVIEGTEQTYKDRPTVALEDVREQAGRTVEAVRVQQAIDNGLPTAQKEAEQAGVQLNKGKKVSSQNLQTLEADLADQLSRLATATVTKRDVDAQLALAISDLKKSGIKYVLNTAPATTNTDKVKEDIKALREAVAEFVNAVETHQSALATVRAAATAGGIKLNETTQDVSSIAELEALNKANQDMVANASTKLAEAQSKLQAAVSSVKVSEVKVVGTQNITAVNAEQITNDIIASIEAVSKADDKALADWEAEVKANREAEKIARETLELAIANAKDTVLTDGGVKPVTKETAKATAEADAKVINDTQKANADEIQRVEDANTKAKAEYDAKNQSNAELVSHVDAINAELSNKAPNIKTERVKVSTKAEADAAKETAVKAIALHDAQVAELAAASDKVSRFNGELSSNFDSFKAQQAANGLEYTSEAGEVITISASDLAGIETLQQLVDKYPEIFQVKTNAVAAVAGTEGTAGTREEVVNQASVDARNEAIKKFEELNNAASSTTPDAGGYTPPGSYTHIKDVTVGGIRAVASGNFDTSSIVNGSYTINLLLPEDGSVQISQVIQSIKFNQGSTLTALDGGEVKEGFLQNKVNIYYNYLNTYGQEALDGQNRSFSNTEVTKWFYDMDADAVVSPTTTYYSVQSGHWYKLSNAVTMADGSTHDLVFYVENINPQNIASGGEWVEIWNQNSAVNMINGYNVLGGELGSSSDNGLKRIYKIGSRDNNTNYVWSGVKSDIDAGQVYSDESDAGVVTVGGAISRANWQASADIGDIKGLRDAPNGTIAEVHYGSEYGGTLRNTNFSATGYTVALADFGNTATLNIIPAVTKDVVETPGTPGTPGTPATPGVVSVGSLRIADGATGSLEVSLLEAVIETPEYNPEAPVLKDAPSYSYVIEDPAKPTPQTIEVPNLVMNARVTEGVLNTELTAPAVSVDTHALQVQLELHNVRQSTTVHPVEVVQTPTNKKAVINADEQDINEATVAKGSTVTWVLSNQFLKAGRPVITGIDLEDYFPDGFEGDVATSLEKSPAWTSRTENGLTVISLKDEEVEKLNLNRDQNVQIPVFRAVGRVLNDQATYENVFKTIIRTELDGGRVEVRYFDEETGREIAPFAVDTENGEIGSSYDTTDLRPQFIESEGVLYERTPKVVGDEQGKVVEGTTVIDYFYKKVEPKPAHGNVVVSYINEDGETIKVPVVDEKDAPVGQGYDTTDNKPEKITHDGIEYVLVPEKTIGEETGEVIEGTKAVTYVYKRVTPKPGTYEVLSNKVVVRTPGYDNPTDPNDPNYDPNRPNDSQIKPTKAVYDEAFGKDINDKNVLQGGKLHYVGTHDLDQYAGIVLSSEEYLKFSGFVDDFDETAVTPNLDEFFATRKGEQEQIKGFKAQLIEDLSLAPQELQDYINWAGISPLGQFIVWTAEDPVAFYNEYVKVGQSIDFHMPMTVNVGFDGTFENTVYQIDFGNGYKGDTVVNHTPKLEPKKDVSIEIDGESLDGKVIALGQEFHYTLNGAILPGNRAEKIWQYDFIDDYDVRGDQYLNEYKVVASADIRVSRTIELLEDAVYEHDVTAADGTQYKAGDTVPAGAILRIVETIKAGTDLTEFTFSAHDEVEGIVTISFTDEFLDSVLLDSEFGATAHLKFKRIAVGEFENTFINRINGVDYISNTVKTSTPAPEVPVVPAEGVPGEPVLETPAPEVPAPAEAPATPVLPNTGEAGSALALLGGIVSTLGLAGLGRRRRD